MKKYLKNQLFHYFGPFPTYLDHFSLKSKHKKNILKYNFYHSDQYSPFPLNAKIEINGTCNLDCVMCLRKSLPNRDKFMSKKQFISVLDNIPSLIEWSPHGYNEPLLHPEFFDFVKETNDRNISLYLVTNATVLHYKNIHKLNKLEPRHIRISIDAIGEKYEKIRQGANYEKVLFNIKYLKRIFGQNVSLYSTIWTENINQISLLQELADNLDMKITFNDITWKNEFGKSRKNKAIRENDIKLDIENNNINTKQPEKRKCSLPWSSIYIDVVGDCFPCTDTFNFNMGNLITTHIKDIYNSELFKIFRWNSLIGENYECKNCLAWSPNYK